MARKTEAFYDALAAHYHLIYRDWREAIGRHGRQLDAIIRAELEASDAASEHPHSTRVLDAACGIGTQALGLAQLGYRVWGGDLSAASIRRAQAWAQDLGLSIDFRCVDMRAVHRTFGKPFDVAIALDNALAHLEPEQELPEALDALRRVLTPGGVFVASLRDYDRLAEEKPKGEPPRIMKDAGGGRREVEQVWRWWSDGSGYDLTLNLKLKPAGGEPQHFSYHASLFVLRRKDLAEALQEAGFQRIRWHERDDTGFHQPVVTALRG
ncbi:MAG: class I SAM-dependent methyltransferase [Rhodovibrionaceae bacterium]|nr:class I SAM-dependent methyltransferase [Rhodovibrionaceae bacterium]